MATQVQISIDCADPERLAHFWAEVLGYQLEEPPSGYDSWSDFSRAVAEPGQEWHAVVDPDGVGPRVLFHRVPEAKVVKNRLHLDVRLPQVRGGRRRNSAGRWSMRKPTDSSSIGATLVRTEDDDDDYFAVMQDPEGNEFCVC